jgi:hypothetical protein
MSSEQTYPFNNFNEATEYAGTVVRALVHPHDPPVPARYFVACVLTSASRCT